MTKLLILPLLFTILATGCTNKGGNSGNNTTAVAPNAIPAPTSSVCSEDYLRSLKMYEKAYNFHSLNVKRGRSSVESERDLKRACLQFTRLYQGTQCTNSRGVARNSSDADAFCGVVSPSAQVPAFLSQYLTRTEGECRNGGQVWALKFDSLNNSNYRQRNSEVALFLYATGKYRLVQKESDNYQALSRSSGVALEEGQYTVGDYFITLQQSNIRVHFRPERGPELESYGRFTKGEYNRVRFDSRGNDVSNSCR